MDYPTALSQYGSEIELHADKTPVLPDIIRKGHVMFLQTSLARKKSDFTTVPKMLGALCESRHIKWTLNSLRSVVWRMVQDLRKLKNKDRDDLLVKARFHELFIFPEQNTSNPAVSPDSSAPDSSAPDSEYSPPSLADFPINPLKAFPAVLKQPTPTSSSYTDHKIQSDPQSKIGAKPCCIRTACATKRQISSNLKQHYIDKLSGKIEIIKKLTKKCSRYILRNNTEKLKRRNKQIEILQKKIEQLEHNEMKNDQGIGPLQKQKMEMARYYKNRRARMKDEWTEKENFMEGQIFDLENRNQILEDENIKLKDKLKDLAEKEEKADVLNLKEGTAYTGKLRKAVYCCVLNSVSLDNVADVLGCVLSELAGLKLDALPSRSSVCRMAREMGSLADLQTADLLLKNPHSTLCWDATTLEGSHINQIHISTDPSTQSTISVETLSGGRTIDYVNHIESAIDTTATTYSECYNTNKDDTKNEMIGNISNTLSDRAAVNHCVNKEFSDTAGRIITELNCNVHPLDGLAQSTKKVIREIENQHNIKGKCFGKDVAAVNLIHAISKMRWKSGSGHPGSFKSFFLFEKTTAESHPSLLWIQTTCSFQAGIQYNISTT